jgi:serine/threonine protein kinase
VTQPTHRLALKPGYKLHWYEIRSMLGKGGFGITYLAHDLNLDRSVAIKEYLPSEFAVRDADDSVHPAAENTADTYAWGLDRFIKEARILSRFEHPNIVRVNAVFEENNTGYMVMAYEQGRSLKDILTQQQTLDESTLLALLMPILDGLAQVHKQGFIHRDIKPDNIYVREDGSPVLLDFGSARQAVAGGSQTMTTLVSPGYAPFEQYYAKGEEQGPWTDIYGLGATLYRAISGKTPMDAVYRSKSMLDGSQDDFQAATQLGHKRYSAGFLAAVDHAIQFRPKDRPQTIAQWIEELRADAPDTNDSDDATRIVNINTPEPNPQPDTGKPKPLKWLAALGSVAIFTLLGAFGYISYSPSQTAGNIAETTKDVSTEAAEKTAPAVVDQQAADDTLAQQQKAEAQRQQDLALAKAQEEAQKKERARLEAERLAEAARLADIEHQQAIKAEKARLAAEKQREKQRRIALEKKQALERKIANSQVEFTKRQAKSKDLFQYYEVTSAKSLTEIKARKVTIEVSASMDKWLGSGINIERGHTYQINASGQWRGGAMCKPTDATGQGMYTLACWDAAKKTVDGYPHSALIGKIGKNTLPFYVGPRFEFTAAESGTLYLMSNDSNGLFFDNTGAMNVTVSLVEQP